MCRVRVAKGPSNNGLHPTADTEAVIELRRAARRVMRGVRRPPCAEAESED